MAAMQRYRPGPERMDDPDATRQELADSLRFIRLVNRYLGGTEALVGQLKRWSSRWPRDRAVTLLDVGTGAGDIPVAAARWAKRAGFDLRITAVDLHPTTLQLAREHIAAQRDVADRITLEQGDALKLGERFAARSFDYVHAGMFLHHLPEIQVLTVLAVMDKLARAGMVWNDLVRSRVALAAAHVLTIITPRIVREDATASVRAGFSRAEVESAARRLELEYARYRSSFWTQRFTLAGEKPGAW